MPEKKSPLEQLGLVSPAALALHLPIRYEDETQLAGIEEALMVLPNLGVQTQGRVIGTEVKFRPRRQLVVTIADADAELILRFLNFYPSQQKLMAVGTHLRVRGDIRQGFFGPEMVHPTVKAVPPDAPLSEQLTPVYSTTAGISQPVIRKAIAKGLKDESVKRLLLEIIPVQDITDTKYEL